MLDLLVKYQKNGQSQLIPGNALARQILDESGLEDGTELRCKLTQPRSVPQNAYWHSLVQEAFANQRSNYPYFQTWKHLRSWLLVETGHCDIMTFPPEAISAGVMAAMNRRSMVWFSVDGEDVPLSERKIHAKFPRSVRFERGASHDEFNEIVTKSITLICDHILPGTEPYELEAIARTRSGYKPKDKPSEKRY